jgi:hypothetical protein
MTRFDRWLMRSRYATPKGYCIQLTIERSGWLVSRLVSYEELAHSQLGWRFVIARTLKCMRAQLRRHRKAKRV